MNSKTIAATIVFVALSLVLTLSPIKIPAPYATFLIYQIWEIPIVVALLLYGPKVGVTVSVINTLALLIIFTGQLPTGPLYNLAAVLSMLLGIYAVQKVTSAFKNKMTGDDYPIEVVAYLTLALLSFVGALGQTVLWFFPACVFVLLSIITIIEARYRKSAEPSNMPQISNKRYDVLFMIASTAVGAFSRVILMSVVNWTFLPFPPPVGFSIPQGAVIAMLPLVGLFNATLALYTIPIGHIIAKLVGKSTKTAVIP